MCAPFWGVAASCLCAICDEIISHDLNMGTCWVDQTPVHQESCALEASSRRRDNVRPLACLHWRKECSGPTKATAGTYKEVHCAVGA